MKLPKKLFVKIVEDGSEHYFAAEEDCETLADEVGGVVQVGCYELTSTGKLATKAEFIADKQRAAVKRS